MKKITTLVRGEGAVHPAKGPLGLVVTVAAALLAVATLFFAAEAGAQATNTQPLVGKTVMIDPGHEGSDLGATYTFNDGSRIAEREKALG